MKPQMPQFDTFLPATLSVALNVAAKKSGWQRGTAGRAILEAVSSRLLEVCSAGREFIEHPLAREVRLSLRLRVPMDLKSKLDATAPIAVTSKSLLGTLLFIGAAVKGVKFVPATRRRQALPALEDLELLALKNFSRILVAADPDLESIEVGEPVYVAGGDGDHGAFSDVAGTFSDTADISVGDEI